VSNAYRSFAYRVDLGVPVERVWRAFTDSRMLARWCAEGASIMPREKGRLHVVFGDDVELDAHIDVLDVMVHVDVESNGLRTARQQPDRGTLLAALQYCGLPELTEDALTLHYLNHGLEIILALPSDQPLPDPEVLLAQIRLHFVEAQPPIAKLSVMVGR